MALSRKAHLLPPQKLDAIQLTLTVCHATSSPSARCVFSHAVSYMSLQADLGRFRLGLHEEEVQLCVSASAILLPDPRLATTTTELLRRLQDGSVWACRGRGLHLTMKILFGGDPLGQEAHEQRLRLSMEEALVSSNVISLPFTIWNYG